MEEIPTAETTLLKRFGVMNRDSLFEKCGINSTYTDIICMATNEYARTLLEAHIEEIAKTKALSSLQNEFLVSKTEEFIENNLK